MTDEQLLEIMAELNAAYPAFYRGVSKADADAAFNLWKRHFSDLPYKGVKAAVAALIDSTVDGFPPTIGAVKDKYYKIHTPAELPPDEAWQTVMKALRNSGYNSASEFEKLPPECKDAVGNPETLRMWSQMETDELNTVVASNFMRTYRARAQSRKEYAVLSQGLKDYIELAASSAVKPLEALPETEKPSIPPADDTYRMTIQDFRNIRKMTDKEYEQSRQRAINKLLGKE